jgi:putative membrane protein
MNRMLIAAAVLAALACGYAGAQGAIPALKTSVPEGEKAVATFFTQDSVGDVQLGKLGLEKSTNSAVRALAQNMVRDHTVTAENGMRVARQIGDTDVRWKPGDDNQIELTRLAKYNGAEFDRQYLKTLVQAHQVDIGTARDAMEFVSTPALRTYLQQTLSVDRRHLAMAQSAQRKL